MKYLSSNVAWDIGRIAYWAGPFAAFGIIYFLPNQELGRDFADYPFGTDAPRYVRALGNPQLHPLVGELLRAWRAMLHVLSIDPTPGAIKLLFAGVGALNVCVAIAAFRTALGPARSLLYGVTYGCSLAVWFFAATPDSYALSTLCYSVYLLAFLNAARHGMTTVLALAMGGALLAALFNDLSAGLLTITPLAYYGAKSWTDLTVRRAAAIQLVSLAAGVLLLGLFTNSLRQHLSMMGRYSPLMAGEPGRANIDFWDGVGEAALGFFFFGIGAPASEATYATARFPDYVGFFQPSLFAYLTHPASAVFLAAYVWMMSLFRPSRMTRVATACLSLVTVRWIAASSFNPGEAILYVSPIVLPWFVFLFTFLEASTFTSKTALLGLFLAALVATNLRFLL